MGIHYFEETEHDIPENLREISNKMVLNLRHNGYNDADSETVYEVLREWAQAAAGPEFKVRLISLNPRTEPQNFPIWYSSGINEDEMLVSLTARIFEKTGQVIPDKFLYSQTIDNLANQIGLDILRRVGHDWERH